MPRSAKTSCWMGVSSGAIPREWSFSGSMRQVEAISESKMKRITIESLLEEIERKTATDERIIVAISGPPGSGKSTLACQLATRIGSTAAVLPMDGFHLDNSDLREMGMWHRKGAPETFDAHGFVALIRKVAMQPTVSFPTFDRQADKTVPNGGQIEAHVRVVFVEGNYLLLNQPGWSELACLFDLTVGLDVDLGELESRLVQRWLTHGLTKHAAEARARENDLRNAEVIVSKSRIPDFLISTS